MDEPQARGYHFERLLTALFQRLAYGREGEGSVYQEQIDGSFQHGGTTYLSARSEVAPCEDRGQGQLSERLEGTRGLFVSFEGFTDGALEAFTARRIILLTAWTYSIR